MAAGIFGLSVAWETGQKLHLIRGFYDPLDIAAYGVGIAAVFLIDLWLDTRTKEISMAQANRSRQTIPQWTLDHLGASRFAHPTSEWALLESEEVLQSKRVMPVEG